MGWSEATSVRGRRYEPNGSTWPHPPDVGCCSLHGPLQPGKQRFKGSAAQCDLPREVLVQAVQHLQGGDQRLLLVSAALNCEW